jgi:hypothetical protein
VPTAFALRADHEPVFAGGVLNVSQDRSFDVGQALQSGGGQIVVEDHDEALLVALDGYAALKRVGAKGAEPTVDKYGEMTQAQLKDELKARALEGVGATKDEMRAALHADDSKGA